jgi:hypothetical protein
MGGESSMGEGDDIHSHYDLGQVLTYEATHTMKPPSQLIIY